ncbi:hypothetical protein H112_02571 [Trichophyton rubrum D6]|uniref:Uncharacterized protein n=3 Tax=Trichophyton TaxID=5550 RepID=A0A080WKW2_TRIRC|nr:uncharacterized protein TERG_12398 [Trichophyton rubrum CBS 118892]EZF24915.1 hypothetical protein H100_02577 [Trichophyton rubrum MR850]EZF43923.1 hypothetical protein H102_02567 [Trichophyton rubrum CBS 100081]EZF54578.1 hypothetical protein H103_02583 [Trichophyton rubrum CBS 288.86]EZF65163.1 hypothetical protein H104_02559 [Trichophyton rubrum CBS 289.86]EZF75853.1 hypothetical protein H105_02586 [Trichophyton soudanense CBS 452.61]EZF86484.1 hypothetical protein H110_02576 [Trichophy
MAEDTVAEGAAETSALQSQPYQAAKTKRGKGKGKEKKDKDDSTPPVKRRCVSTACIACRKRKSKVCLPIIASR